MRYIYPKFGENNFIFIYFFKKKNNNNIFFALHEVSDACSWFWWKGLIYLNQKIFANLTHKMRNVDYKRN